VDFATCVDPQGKKYNTAMDNITPSWRINKNFAPICPNPKYSWIQNLRRTPCQKKLKKLLLRKSLIKDHNP
jgi:hypothetical protein